MIFDQRVHYLSKSRKKISLSFKLVIHSNSEIHLISNDIKILRFECDSIEICFSMNGKQFVSSLFDLDFVKIQVKVIRRFTENQMIFKRFKRF